MTVAPSRETGSSLPDPTPGGTTPGGTAAYDRADWASAYRNVTLELDDVTVPVARGAVPAGLVGTLYRNGPGRLERGGRWVHHPFDGDGMIAALRFGNGSATLRNRFVRTEGWQAEEGAGRFLFRGVFGTQKPGGVLANAFDVRLKNIANTHVVRLGDRLLALWEASSPHELDPDTLETRGLTLLDGVLQPGEAFAAHPRFDPGHHGEPRMVTFGVSSGPRSTVRLMEFATDGENAGQLIRERRDSFPGFAFLHDFAITPRWAVFMRNAMAFNPLPFALGWKGAAQCLASQPGRAGEFWLIPRTGGEVVRLAAPAGFVFHHLNAHEDEASGDVVVDSIVYDDFPSIGPGTDFREVDFDAIPAGRLQRCRIDTARGTVRTEVLEERCCEFAMVHPDRQGLPPRFAWMAVAERERGNDPLQAIEKLDLASGERRVWSAAPRGFVSEPVMVPAPAAELPDGRHLEDWGWVLCLVWNGARCASDLVILDAASMQEVAVLELPLAIPHGLHGSWVPA
jgi:all-trans-8'-apo-beta-carotenal 15,15'-oxygenase